MEINEEQLNALKELCGSAKICKKCKDKNKLCFYKKSVFRVAQLVYKRRVKKGLIDEHC